MVASEPSIPADLGRRFGGLERLYGVVGAARIRAAHVVVVGIGGVGSWAAEALARSAIGRLTLVDMDHVAESNINRQIQAVDSTLGMAKVLAMKSRIHGYNPVCLVQGVEEFVDADNWPGLLDGRADVVIDACDQVRAKVVLAQWARSTRTPLICVGAAGGKRHAHKVDIQDLSKVTHDPILAQLRYRLRREHGAPSGGKNMGLDCVFSAEPVSPADPSCGLQEDTSLNCHGYGSVVTVTATFGQCAAAWALEKVVATAV